MITANYSTAVFNVTDIDAAKRIILTPEIGLSTDERWMKETPYLMGLMENLNLSSGSLLVDYGAGIGRLSKAAIEKYDCIVAGVDISMNMRALSNVYVNHPQFFSIAPEATFLLDNKADAVIAVWALQHVHDLNLEIQRIKNMLKPGGKLFVVNERRRFIPTDKGWIDDSRDIFIALQSQFTTSIIDMMDSDVVTEAVAKRTFYGIFVK